MSDSMRLPSAALAAAILAGALVAPTTAAEPVDMAPAASAETVSETTPAPAGEPARASDAADASPEGGDDATQESEAAAETPEDDEDSPPVFQLSITGAAWFSSQEGFLQTSRGGGAATTSWCRPTLDEVGLDGLRVLPLIDARLTLFGAHELHANFVGLDIDGSAVLTEPLVSQAVLFPAGSAVQSDLELNMLRFGYRATWLAPKISTWRLVPEIGVSIDPFSYQLRSPTVVASVDRSYTTVFPYLAILLEGPIVGNLRGEVDVAGSAGIATFLDVDLRLAYQLVDLDWMTASAVVGLKGTWLERRDHQEPQYNHYKVLMGSFSTTPWNGFYAGLRLGF